MADETAPDGPVLSLVDDAFYVLLKSFQRAVRSGHTSHVVVPLLSQIVDAARQRCVPALHERMREAAELMPSWLVPRRASPSARRAAPREQPHLEWRSSESGTRSKCSRRFM